MSDDPEKEVKDWVEALEELRKWTKTEVMNEDRARKILLLLDIIDDILLEEDLTQTAFKHIRGVVNGKRRRERN